MSTPSPAGLEYAARYTHTYRDGRTVDVISVNHANPTDRPWAVERVTEMVRAQQALGRTVDAHLAVRRAATEWEPERLGPLSAYQPALNAALAISPMCCCEFVDISVGMQRVTEDPECPVHTREGAAAWYLRIFTPYIVAAERARIERLGPSEETTLTESIGRVAAYLSDGPPRTDQIADGKVRHAQATDHISRRSAGFAGGIELFHDLLYSDLVVVLAAARVEANALTASPEPADASPAISGEAEAERLKPAYPEPGSEIPGQPGYVVGTCGHRLAGSEWRAGFRTCENCTDAQDDDA